MRISGGNGANAMRTGDADLRTGDADLRTGDTLLGVAERDLYVRRPLRDFMGLYLRRVALGILQRGGETKRVHAGGRADSVWFLTEVCSSRETKP